MCPSPLPHWVPYSLLNIAALVPAEHLNVRGLLLITISAESWKDKQASSLAFYL